jgi:hypothetical protein
VAKSEEAAPAGRPPGLQIPHSPLNGLTTAQSFRRNAVQARAIRCLPRVFPLTVLSRQQHPKQAAW